jgi:penicillin V acylase-like amidase (Ntn superfamily)
MRTPLTTALCGLLLSCLLIGSSRACTCFCLDTPDGPVFGSNLDLFIPGDGLVFINQRGIAKESFPSLAGATGRTAKWVSRYGSVTFNLAGREWAFGGMNEAGLVLGTMELRASEFPRRDERPALPIGPWAQYVLDTCGTVREAIQVDSKVRIEDPAPPVHYLIADADGDCAALEGNVEQSFTDYDHDVNLKVFRTLCARYKVKISEQEAIDIMRHLEGFKPVRREAE